MKGIILAGGSGTRLYPMTKVMAKQLQPVYDKPMIYYPLSVLMLGGIKDILIITTLRDQDSFQILLGDGSQYGVKISYEVQAFPDGLPEAFIVGEQYIKNEDVCLILGDNLFYGDMNFFRNALEAQRQKKDGIGARIFAYKVSNPQAYGVVEFDRNTKLVKSIEEKPIHPRSDYAIPGLYIFNSEVTSKAKELKKSCRNETEIVDLIFAYKRENTLGVEIIDRGVTWMDMGESKSLLEASSYVASLDEEQGGRIACLEEVAWRMGYINFYQLEKLILEIPSSFYKEYLEKLVKRIHTQNIR